MDIIQSLISKLIDEADHISNGEDENTSRLEDSFQSGDFFSQLDQDELQILEDILDQLEFYVEYVGPLLLILIPCFICWIRSRFFIRTQRNNQVIADA